MNSLVREALRGKPRAIKEVLKIFEKAGLLDVPVGQQTHGSLVIPKGFTWPAFRVLLSNWDIRLGIPRPSPPARSRARKR